MSLLLDLLDNTPDRNKNPLEAATRFAGLHGLHLLRSGMRGKRIWVCLSCLRRGGHLLGGPRDG